jgi:hypothetical protein
MCESLQLMPAPRFCACSYEYLVLDDCWAERERPADGKLVGHKARFPSGMKVGAALRALAGGCWLVGAGWWVLAGGCRIARPCWLVGAG